MGQLFALDKSLQACRLSVVGDGSQNGWASLAYWGSLRLAKL